MSSDHPETLLQGHVSVLKKGFGFIKCPSIAKDVFFHDSSIQALPADAAGSVAQAPAAAAVASGAAADATTGLPAAAAPRQPDPDHSASQQLAVGEPVAFKLAADSRPAKPVAASVVRLPPPDDEAPPSSSGRTVLGVVVTPARPPGAGRAAWAGRLRNGLIRFFESADGSSGGGGSGGGSSDSLPSSSGETVRHVAFGLADIATSTAAASGSCEPQPGAAVLEAGSAVWFQLVVLEKALLQQQHQHQRQQPAAPNPRAAFWATHGARQVSALPAADEALLLPDHRRQLALLRLLVESEDVFAAAGPPPPV
jgi:hypothetical protein